MELGDLIKMGFNKNESKVYLALAKFGKADAGRLIKETKFHKNIVYDNLEKLIDKGLVTFVLEGNRRVFQIAPPRAFQELFSQEQKELDEKKELASKLTEEIKRIKKKEPYEQEAQVYRGVKAIKSFYNDTLSKNFYVFGAPQESIEIMGDIFWENYTLKRVKNKVKTKMIFNPSIRGFGRRIGGRYTEIRYFERDFEPLTETHIQDDKVAIIVWTEEPVLFLIKDKNVARSYLKYFETMWKQAKK